ncbi:hypothetical protein SLEP1_g24397 [Rubroshorea leprosula]|uniref:Uncharacterized protein n=1 Tax=Rubroshorea leprosula TaxID=152421 RepID=A0AAV5JQ45_9ROSI|nr:hypothetical protein SLEP1_g24397 [Rubroshorea leprosula]
MNFQICSALFLTVRCSCRCLGVNSSNFLSPEILLHSHRPPPNLQL